MDSPTSKEPAGIETSGETDKIAPKGFIEKLRSQSESTRRIILWVIVIVFAAGLLFIWTKNTKQKLESLRGEELKKKFQLPSLEEDLKGLPKIEMPNPSEEELKKIEEELEELEKETLPENQ